MVLSDELSLDSNSNYMTYKKLSNFYEDFVTLEYGYGDSTMYSSVSDVSRANDKSGNVVLEVDAGLMKADYINMIITIRNMRTKIVLKSAEQFFFIKTFKIFLTYCKYKNKILFTYLEVLNNKVYYRNISKCQEEEV